MHPILKSRRRLLLYLLAWLPVALMLAAVLHQPDGPSWAGGLALAVPACLLHAFICLASWYLVRAHPIGRTPPSALASALGAGALVSTGAWLGILALSFALFFPDATPIGLAAGPRTVILAGFGLLLYLLAVALHYLLAAFEESRAAERRLLELDLLSRETELKLLRAQIDPHFLFNSLNSIAALTYSDPEGARRMCTKLGEFFRQGLRLGGEKEVRLGEELALARSFLEVEKIRFGDRLRVEEEVAPGCEECPVPPLILQPLIENAVVHGISSLVEGGTVRLEVRRQDNRLRMAVENPREGAAGSRSRGGLGIENVRRRLRRFYGPDSEVEVEAERDRFRITLTVPIVGGA